MTRRRISICLLVGFWLSAVASVMAREETWYTGEVQHVGFPLMLRFPEKSDLDALEVKYPRLLTITHHLDKVKASGLPEPGYNKSLADFDHEVIVTFQAALSGKTVLVETFAGKRAYYIYVSPTARIQEAKKKFAKNFPKYRLDWETQNDPKWTFIRRYSKDYNFYPGQ